ncbi:MAG: MFS transporter, partial [Saprospiraceae bacterium]|nr:MFS transporter [Saprospiraceae bacterium]
LLSVYFISNPDYLGFSMIGVGMAWASILAMPYAMLAGAIPAKKMGIYMGIFNFFITVPQIINGLIGGPMLKSIYGNHAIYALVTSGILMIIGAIAATFVKDKDDVVVRRFVK